ncbi:MAG: hypothetical protein ACFFDT_29310 [Candidatus Hodarchaeota archaeon]
MSEEVGKIEKKLEEHEERISRLERLFQTKLEVIKKKTSIKEFILQKRPKGDVQKALVIGYYLEKYQDFSGFSAKDVEQGFRDAREKIPANVGDKIRKNIAKGPMMEAEEEKDEMKAYFLTSSGERFVENDFRKEE